ncbi:hypothetical protein ACWC5C_20925 [Streptomyces sp. NPDC001700]
MSSKQGRKAFKATDQEEEAVPDSEKPSTSAAEVSSKAADAVDTIDDVLEEFDELTLDELGFGKEEVVDPATIDEAITRKLDEYVQKGGQ